MNHDKSGGGGESPATLKGSFSTEEPWRESDCESLDSKTKGKWVKISQKIHSKGSAAAEDAWLVACV